MLLVGVMTSIRIYLPIASSQLLPTIVSNAGCHGSVSPNTNAHNLSSYNEVMEKTKTIEAFLTEAQTSHTDRITTLDEDDKQQLLDWLNE